MAVRDWLLAKPSGVGGDQKTAAAMAAIKTANTAKTTNTMSPRFANFFTFFNFTVKYVGNVVRVVSAVLTFGKVGSKSSNCKSGFVPDLPKGLSFGKVNKAA